MTMIVDGTNGLTLPDGYVMPTYPQGWRNRIINGDMRVDQRNAGASVTVSTNPVYTVDRWYGGKSGTVNNFTAQRSATAPAGFTNSLLITTGTGVTPVSGDFLFLSQAIEGVNFADLGWGTAGAQTITISFWVRCSLTGTFGMGVRNGAANRSYIASYTINSANTFEYKTVTIPGDTSGTWATDNTQACGVFFDLGNGSNFSAAGGSWQSSNLLGGLTGGVKLAATTGATFYITGVQLEKGSVATPFEYLDYSEQLRRCQRYAVRFGGDSVYEHYSLGVAISTALVNGTITHPTPMRVAPSIAATSGSFTCSDGGAGITASLSGLASSGAESSTKISTLNWSASGFTQFRPYHVYSANSTATYIILSAEL